MFLGELHVPNKIRIHSLKLHLLLDVRFPSRVAMVLPGLIVSGMILRFCHFCKEFLQLTNSVFLSTRFHVPCQISIVIFPVSMTNRTD